MKMQSSTKNANFYSEPLKKATSKQNQSTNYPTKRGLTDEMIEYCRANLVNYYVCYGSAVVSVRNAERTFTY
jgi:hypothetical protein